MSMIKKSISITDKQDLWIRSQVECGHYGNESEVIRDLIRQKQIQETETPDQIERIRAKLIEAEHNDFVTETPEQILQTIKQELRLNGNLQT